MRIIERLIQLTKQSLPHFFYGVKYYRSASKIDGGKGARARLFSEFLRKAQGPSLQISIKDEIGRKFGSNWVSIDRYDYGPQIDRHDDIENLKLPDSSFEAAVCWSVLEHVPHPQKAVAELYRILKPGGLIWVQLPFLYPYHQSPQHDFWRVTPSGLRIWMEDFETIACACDYWSRSRLVAATYFYGRKPQG
jgi:SAM-dependent methyltransferase